jgi:hypothetical protein
LLRSPVFVRLLTYRYAASHCPVDMRGRVIGLFNMASLGLRAFGGVSVGVLVSLIGVHWSLALAAIAMLAIAGGLLALP